MNIRIAKVCGWKFSRPYYLPTPESGRRAAPERWVHDEHYSVYSDIPRNYTGDLNHIREAEMQLLETDEQLVSFIEHLRGIRRDVRSSTFARAETIMFATAAQRAEALCRTLNL